MNSLAGAGAELRAAVDKAVRYLGFRSRSVYEMESFLAGKKIPQEIIQSALEFLIRRQYLDDRVFAGRFVESRTRQSPKSRYALGYELRQKGVAPHIIDDALARVDDHEMALAALESRTRKWQRLDVEALKPKIMNFLRYRGFSYETCLWAWEQFCAGHETNGKKIT